MIVIPRRLLRKKTIEPGDSHFEKMWVEMYPLRPAFPRFSFYLYQAKLGVHISAFVYVAVVFLTLVGGIAAELFAEGQNWFSRTGSVIVSLGIIFGAMGVEGRIRRDINWCDQLVMAWLEGQLDHNKEEITHKEAPMHLARIVTMATYKAVASYRREDWKKRIFRNTVWVDAACLIVGTIVWGFGDLIW